MDVFLIQLLSFFSILLFVLSLNALRHRRDDTDPAGNRPGVFGWFPEEISAVGRLCEPSIGALFPEENKQIQNNLVAAALDNPLTMRDVRGLQVCLGVTAFFVVALFVLVVTLDGVWAVIGGLMFGLIGYTYPVIWLRRAAKRRQAIILKEMPFAIDLLTVAMEAGQDFGAAVRHFVSETVGGPLRHEFAIMLEEVAIGGKSRIDAMHSMAARIQLDEFKSVVAAVVQSTEMGASVGTALKLQAEETRRARFHRAERQAARAPSLMLIPVALFILPAVFIIILTPVGMRMMNALQSVK